MTAREARHEKAETEREDKMHWFEKNEPDKLAYKIGREREKILKKLLKMCQQIEDEIISKYRLGKEEKKEEKKESRWAGMQTGTEEKQPWQGWGNREVGAAYKMQTVCISSFSIFIFCIYFIIPKIKR